MRYFNNTGLPLDRCPAVGWSDALTRVARPRYALPNLLGMLRAIATTC